MLPQQIALEIQKEFATKKPLSILSALMGEQKLLLIGILNIIEIFLM